MASDVIVEIDDNSSDYYADQAPVTLNKYSAKDNQNYETNNLKSDEPRVISNAANVAAAEGMLRGR